MALKPLIDNAVNLLRKRQKREIKDVPNSCLAKYDTEISQMLPDQQGLQSINLSEQGLADLLTAFESSWSEISVGAAIQAVIQFLIYLLLLVDIFCGGSLKVLTESFGCCTWHFIRRSERRTCLLGIYGRKRKAFEILLQKTDTVRSAVSFCVWGPCHPCSPRLEFHLHLINPKPNTAENICRIWGSFLPESAK